MCFSLTCSRGRTFKTDKAIDFIVLIKTYYS